MTIEVWRLRQLFRSQDLLAGPVLPDPHLKALQHSKHQHFGNTSKVDKEAFQRYKG